MAEMAVRSSVDEFRALCWRCRRPRSVCWCESVTALPSKTHVVFIQHPREAKVPVSTCRMAHLSLLNSEMHVELRPESKPSLLRTLQGPDVAVLFPSTSAVDIESMENPPQTLVVVDGTWSNAKKLVEQSKVLSGLPRVRFSPLKPGNYRIRKEPDAHCYSTIEAVAYVLERLERAPGQFAPLLRVFDAMVDKQLTFIESNHRQTRHKRRVVRNTVRVDPLAELKSSAAHIVAVFAEANAWPTLDSHRPPGQAELIQLVALRVASQECFESLWKPIRPLSPSVPANVEVSASAFESALERVEAQRAFRSFVQPNDVLVGWGTWCGALMNVEGLLGNARFVNVRGHLAQALGARPGSVEAVATRLGWTAHDGEGRSLRRLRALGTILKALSEDSAAVLEALRTKKTE
jgi:DTW domain-containing protein